jgi:hypothetical protein
MLSREEVWQSWRQQLLRAWASDHRATMTVLLEDGPEASTAEQSPEPQLDGEKAGRSAQWIDVFQEPKGKPRPRSRDTNS